MYNGIVRYYGTVMFLRHLVVLGRGRFVEIVHFPNCTRLHKAKYLLTPSKFSKRVAGSEKKILRSNKVFF